MTDIFEEAEEELRTEAWLNIAKRSAPMVGSVLGGALAIALCVWGYTSWQDNQAFEASVSYDKALEALRKNDAATATTTFKEVSQKGNAAYRALAFMQLGGIALNAGKTDEAVKDFDAASAAKPSQIIADAAAMRAAGVRVDSASLDEMHQRLDPLAAANRPFAAIAKETLAYAKIRAGDIKGARSDFQNLAIGLNVPPVIKSRATTLIGAIDSGAVSQASELAKLPISDLSPATAMPDLQAAPQQ